MDKVLSKEFASAVYQGIASYIEENPGAEKYIDWFTVLASHNLDVESSQV